MDEERSPGGSPVKEVQGERERIAKAFDKCCHGVIALKMRTKVITGKLGRWIYSFLTNRIQCVIVNKVKSGSSTMKAFSKSSVLAPVLFLILISDMYKDATYSTVSSFADGTGIFTRAENVEDTANLQTYVNQVFQWTTRNNMINEDKFQLMRFGKKKKISKRKPRIIRSQITLLKEMAIWKNLQVIMLADLTCKQHNESSSNNWKKNDRLDKKNLSHKRWKTNNDTS
ncbi:uncharacterized protein [Procambarus clarkii]|uniref:uncharacterized protein n=1 Tax=Procambarus clarkii TaxID=6728 RepID=UPI003741FF7B